MNEHVRILYVIESLGFGGAERSLADLAPCLADRGHDVSIASLYEREGFAGALRRHGSVELIDVGRSTRLGRVSELRDLLASRPWDVVHTQLFEADLAGIAAAALARRPVVTSLVNVGFGPEQASQPGIRRSRLLAAQAATAALYRVPRRFHAVSETVATVMARRLLIDRMRIDVIPRGRDETRLGRSSADRRRIVRTALGVDDGAFVVLAVARHERQKGLDVLLDSLPLIRQPGIKLVIAGREGNQTAELRSHPAMDDRVSFLGHRDDVGDLMVAADVLVMPSRWEGLPGTLIEALALEVPIVASSIPQVEEVVGGLPGVNLVAPEDARALAHGVDDMLLRPPSSLASHRGRFCERFSMPAVTDATERFYRRAIAGTE